MTKGRTKERVVERALPKQMKMEAQRRRAKVVQRALPKWIMKVRSQRERAKGRKALRRERKRREKVMAVTLLLTKGKCDKQMTPRAPHLTKVR